MGRNLVGANAKLNGHDVQNTCEWTTALKQGARQLPQKISPKPLLQMKPTSHVAVACMLITPFLSSRQVYIGTVVMLLKREGRQLGLVATKYERFPFWWETRAKKAFVLDCCKGNSEHGV